MFEDFNGKVLFVTGAASGMGRAVAVRFGSLGCKVAVAAGTQDPDAMISHVIPMGKMGTTQDIADSVVYLCSSMAGHITGMVLPVCGGMQM